MTRRPGLSLTEVLVALFIMAIGVMGVLTMFPLGAVQMGQAIKDERCAECANQADSYMQWYWRTYVVGRTDDPIWQKVNEGTATQAGPPVFVDPMGRVARTGTAATKVAIDGEAGLDRMSVRPVTEYSGQPETEKLFALRTCTLLDGFSYNENGTIQATEGSSGNLERENRYNWMWVLQRPKGAPNVYTVDMTVVVFDRRIHMYTPSAPEIELKTASGAGFATGESSVTVTGYKDPDTGAIVNGAIPPGLQKGSWVADISKTSDGVQLCDFHRLVSTTKSGSNINLEFQSTLAPPLGGGTRPTSRGMYFGGVAEAFRRPQLKP